MSVLDGQKLTPEELKAWLDRPPPPRPCVCGHRRDEHACSHADRDDPQAIIYCLDTDCECNRFEAAQ